MNDKIQHINAIDFQAVVLDSPIPVIVDFYSDECPPCEVLAPIFEKMEDCEKGHRRRVCLSVLLENVNTGELTEFPTEGAFVFAAGDVRTKAISQVVTAASDGAVAGIMAERYVSSHWNFLESVQK